MQILQVYKLLRVSLTVCSTITTIATTTTKANIFLICMSNSSSSMYICKYINICVWMCAQYAQRLQHKAMCLLKYAQTNAKNAKCWHTRTHGITYIHMYKYSRKCHVIGAQFCHTKN